MNRNITLNLPLEDALRLTGVLVSGTDDVFIRRDQAGSKSHRRTIEAEQKIIRQINSQINSRDLQEAKQQLSPEELECCVF